MPDRMANYVTKPTPQDFGYALAKKWSSGVSGGLSVPFTIVAIYATNPNVKLSFALLAILGMVFASYSLWSQEREERIKTQEQLDVQTAKFGRPEVTLELKSDDMGRLWVCCMNHSDRAAVNLRIENIPCGDELLGFINPPNQLTSGFSPNIQVSYKHQSGKSENDIATACILNLKKEDGAMELTSICDSLHQYRFGRRMDYLRQIFLQFHNKALRFRETVG